MRHLPLLLLALPSLAHAADLPVLLALKDHRFVPAELRVPAGQRIRITIENQDNSPEEFESYELNREKVIPGRSKGVVFIGPLKPGRYPFFGEFNQATAQGVVIAE